MRTSALYGDLLKRLDDSSDQVRVLGCRVLAAFFRAEGGRLTRIAVSHAEPGSGNAPLAWHDKYPVTQLTVKKAP